MLRIAWALLVSKLAHNTLATKDPLGKVTGQSECEFDDPVGPLLGHEVAASGDDHPIDCLPRFHHSRTWSSRDSSLRSSSTSASPARSRRSADPKPQGFSTLYETLHAALAQSLSANRPAPFTKTSSALRSLCSSIAA